MNDNKVADPRTTLAGERTSLANFRTAIALDRTTLASIRTTLTMGSFGFGMIGFFRALHEHAWKVDGTPIEVGPGQALCIPRGAVHRFDNLGNEDVKQLAIISPR